MITETDIQNIKTALQCWDADIYDDWIHVGMALKADGYPFYIWDEWSKTGRSYKSVIETQYKWDSFRNNDGGAVTTKSIFKRAIDDGMKFNHNPDPKKRNPKETDYAIPRDFVIGLKYDDGHLHLPAYVQLWRYLEVLYKPDDIIGVTTKEHTHLDGGKWKPAAGESVKVSDVISTLKSTMDIEKAVGVINPKAGAWIYLNTYDGEGFGNNNCVTFKYTLIECDKLTPEEQEKLYIERRLPIAALVTSGARSVHAIVRIDASDIDEYSRRVRYMHDYLQRQGLPLDMGVGNPARMSRMPGVKRNGAEQSLLLIEGMDKLRTCCHDYLEWERYTKGETPKTATDEKPKHDPLNFVYPMEYTIPPELPPAVISGLLRKGGKMVITGAPKSHKTALLMELAVCMSEGLPFLGMDTLPTKTLYINTEYTEESCINRILNVRECMGLERRLNKMLPTLNIKGKQYTIDELVTQLVEEHKNEDIGMIILDPIYKVMQGDENKAADMAVFLGWLDKLTVEMNCSVVYSHHHSKGTQGQKDAMDRGSGSGVVSRDFDALIDITRLEADEGVLKDEEEGWRFEFVARDFKSPDTMDTIFEYPIHHSDKDGVLATAAVKGSPEYEAKIKSEATVKRRTEKTEKSFADIESQLDAVFGTTVREIAILDAVKKIETLDWAEKIDIRTRRRKVQEHCESAGSKYGYEVRARLGILFRK